MLDILEDEIDGGEAALVVNLLMVPYQPLGLASELTTVA